MKQPPLLVSLLVITTLLVDVVVHDMASDQDFPAPSRVLLFALAFSQISLLSLFAALGTAHRIERFVAIAAGIVVWVWALGSIESAPVESMTKSMRLEKATVFVTQAIAVTLLAGWGRLAGFRWTATNTGSESQVSRAGQFTLAGLLGATTLVSIVAGLAKYAVYPDTDERLGFALFLMGNSTVALASVWTVHAHGHLKLRFTVTILATSLFGILVGKTFAPKIGPGPFIELNVLQALFIMGSIAACRASGLVITRMDRRT